MAAITEAVVVKRHTHTRCRRRRISGVPYVKVCLIIRPTNTLTPAACFFRFTGFFFSPLERLHVAHQSWSLQTPSVPLESSSCSCSQSELAPRPLSNCPGMFGGAQSNWTVTITNGWFAAPRHCNVALNERKHAHQFHTVANTILLWVIVVGHFSFKVRPRLGNSFLIAVCACVCVRARMSISWRGDN